MISTLIDFILHIDQHLVHLSAQYGPWIYAILFVVIFCETGLVVTPFLPGDSLLFAAGGIAAIGGMDIHVMVLLLLAAAILGDAANFMIGKYFGQKLFAQIRIPKFSAVRIWKKPMRSMKNTAAKPSSLRALCRLCGRLRHLSQAWAICTTHVYPLQHYRRSVVGIVVFLCRLLLRQYPHRQKQSGLSHGGNPS